MATLQIMQGLMVYFCVFMLLHSQFGLVGGGRFITGNDRVYRLKNNNSVCMTLSFNARFVFWYSTHNDTGYNSTESKTIYLPNNTETTISGDCTSYPDTRLIVLEWENNVIERNTTFNFSITFNFSVTQSNWHLSQVQLNFSVDDGSLVLPESTDYQSYQTDSGVSLFNRTFNRNQYFYCKSCKTLWLVENGVNATGPCYLLKVNDTNSVCSYLELSKSVIYPGNLVESSSVSKKLCIEDYIELQEIIIPAVVGGILALLLTVIFLSYFISFVRRKRKEGRYETLGEGY